MSRSSSSPEDDDAFSMAQEHVDNDGSLSDIQAAIKYLKRRVGDCASASQVENIEDNVIAMVRALLDERSALQPRSGEYDHSAAPGAYDALSRRLDSLQALADGMQQQLRNIIENRAKDLNDVIDQLAGKHRETRSALNTCINDVQTLRKDMKEVKHKQRKGCCRVAAGAAAENTASSSTGALLSPGAAMQESELTRTNEEEDEAEANLYWKNIVQKAYGLPKNVDWPRVRLNNERRSILCSRIANRKWYIHRDKMDFAGKRGSILAQHVPEFLARLKEDCPAVRIGKHGRRLYTLNAEALQLE